MSKRSATLKSLVATVIFAASASMPLSTAALAQQAYDTPQKAVDALVAAVKSNDLKATLAVLGRGGKDIISSGDKVADEATNARFLATFDARHQITMAGESKAVLTIGTEDYPFAIPLLRKKNGMWSFDTAAGRREILYRRIGRNELSTIQTSLAYVDAQRDYASKDRTSDGPGIYAQRFLSSPGKKDGLYWPAAAGEDRSPLGEFFAEATADGYRAGEGPTPYHGYYYRILTRQGRAAGGGAANYLVNGKMIGGFALVAYPAQYRNSGVMTFIVNHAGEVYQKDLGSKTDAIASQMLRFSPNSSWTKVDAADRATK